MSEGSAASEAAVVASRVRVEFRRIQTYLFRVSKMRTILGANALVGEVLRVELPDLARNMGSCLPEGCQVASEMPGEVVATGAGTGIDWTADNPVHAWSMGVLARDGGHFQCLFDKVDCAAEFAAAAARHIRQRLPDLMFEIHVEAWLPATSDTSLAAGWKPMATPANDDIRRPVLSDFRTCQWSGVGVATDEIRLGKESFRVSRAVRCQWDAGEAFQEGKTRDRVGLLRQARSEGGECLLPGHFKDPQTLEELAGGEGRYLALIHVDGNGVGGRTPWCEPAQTDADPKARLQHWLDAEAQVERFFHSLRTTVQAALVRALGELFPKPADGAGTTRHSPFQLLMMGGDDILVCMQAEYALPFVIALARQLKAAPLSDGKPLDIAAGVAIAQSSFPFGSLHSMAEELASSAKRLARRRPGISVVDWQTVTTSAITAIDRHRNRHQQRAYLVPDGEEDATEVIALSARPCPILREDELDDAPSLQRLESCASKLSRAPEVARSQLRHLRSRLGKGLQAGRMACQDLPAAILYVLGQEGLADPWPGRLSLRFAAGDAPDASGHVTALADLIDIFEIPRLGVRLHRVQDGVRVPGAIEEALP